MLIDGFDDIEAQPFTSGGFADLYRATYKGQQVVAKTLKTAYVDDPNSESVHKVNSLIFGRAAVQFAYTKSSAFCE